MTNHCNFRNFMITKILNKRHLDDEKNYQLLIFSLNIDQKQRIRSMIFSKNSESKKKRLVTKWITKFDYIFDTKDSSLCVVYDETVNEKSYENLSIKFVIL